MKVCFAGLGSIGKRHFKNLKSVSEKFDISLEIHAFRETTKVIESSFKLDKCFHKIEEADQDYDIVFICNPTYKHFATINNFINKTRNMFIEKPIFDSLNYNPSSILSEKGGVYYVASPLKFSPIIEYTKTELLRENVFCARAICSSYLPDWRKGVDYRQSYSSKKNEGGGVSLDLIHEWDYLRYLFGDPDKVHKISGKYSNLEIDSDDLAIYIAEYADKAIELHLDYFGRKSERSLRLYTDNGTIVADILNNKIFFSNDKILCFDNKDIYEKEMEYFIRLILDGGENINTVDNAIKTMRLALGGL